MVVIEAVNAPESAARINLYVLKIQEYIIVSGSVCVCARFRKSCWFVVIGDVFLFLCRGITEAARGTSGAEEEVGERIPAFKRWEHHERVFVSESDTDRERETRILHLCLDF